MGRETWEDISRMASWVKEWGCVEVPIRTWGLMRAMMAGRLLVSRF
jgi:hypothetical protein